MFRRLTMTALAAGLLAAGVGCRSSCGERRGLFGLCNRSDGGGDHLLGFHKGNNGGTVTGFEGDCGVPGQLTGLPAQEGVPLMPAPGPVPGGVAPGRPDELPFPQPSGDLIPRPGVPFAPPTPAPAEITTPSSRTPAKNN